MVVLRMGLLGVLVAGMSFSALAGPAVNESARQIPVAAEADVVVVGGGTGAVAAAVAAAESGAKVFLAAPRLYLGEDMTATLRLWLEPGETPDTPLAEQVLIDPRAVQGLQSDPNRLECTYTADESAKTHKDTSPPGLLVDGKWGNASSQSVQYNGDATIVADLGSVKEIAGARLIAYHREGSGSSAFRVRRLTVSTSTDGKQWKEGGQVEAAKAEAESDLLVFFAPLAAKARYVKLFVEKEPDVERILLGEIEILAPSKTPKVAASGKLHPRPMHIKKQLDDALLKAGVTYLYGCQATDVLRDGQGRPAGIVMANRAGRQAIIAKTIIDATDRALVARLAGGKFRPYPAGQHTFTRVVIGGDEQKAPNMTARAIDPPFRGSFPNPAKTSSGEFKVIEYTLRLPMSGDTPSAWAAADQQARTLTYHAEQQFTSDSLFELAPDPMHAEAAAGGPWAGADAVPLTALRPAGVPRIYVLGACADVPRDQAAKLVRPVALIRLGQRVGQAAAKEAKQSTVSDVHLPGQTVAQPASAGEVREMLQGTRPSQKYPTIPQSARALPVLGTYDVVVVGGGTSGAPAGIGAARQGAKTLVVEYLSTLGGVGTEGAISKYYWGNRIGFTATVAGGASWVIEQKVEWYRSELLKAGAHVWYGTVGCGALVEGNRVIGAVVATPQGRGVVLAKAVIDTTGNSDVAAAAGAACMYTDETEFGMQGTGLPPRNLGTTYTNTDFTITDETDMVDIWHLFVYAKEKYPQAFDQGRLIDTRERRRIVGEFTMNLLDQMLGRTYPDTVNVAYSNFDTHGYTIDPYLMLEHPEKRGVYVNVPYRCLVPQAVDGILVGGLGISVHRDAVPLVRMQPDLQNLGYAAGVAAAMTSKSGSLLRNVDMKALQRHLIEIGNLPETVLEDRDSFPLPLQKVAAAVEELKNDFRGSAVVLAQPEQSLPLLRKAYASASGEEKGIYAKVLAMMGDAAGIDILIAEIRNTPDWDQGWRYRGGGQFGHALSKLDTLLVGLGRTRDRRAVPVILEKLKLLDAESEFSHHRAAALALELIGDPAAAQPLAEALGKPGMRGFAHRTIDEAKLHGVPGGTAAVQTRSDSLRELVLARALYRCGDAQGLGEKILREYAGDLRGHLARHAQAVLEKSGKPKAESGTR